MTQNNTDDLVVDDEFDIEDPDTRAELGLPPIEVEDVPDDLQFTSRAEDKTAETIERLPILIDHQRFWLTKPSDGTMYVFGRKLASLDPDEQFDAMMKIVDICLDDRGVEYIMRRLADPANDYDDGLVGRLVATVIDRWGSEVLQRMYKRARAMNEGRTGEPANRAQRRAAAKKPAARKAPAKKAAARRKG